MDTLGLSESLEYKEQKLDAKMLESYTNLRDKFESDTQSERNKIQYLERQLVPMLENARRSQNQLSDISKNIEKHEKRKESLEHSLLSIDRELDSNKKLLEEIQSDLTNKASREQELKEKESGYTSRLNGVLQDILRLRIDNRETEQESKRNHVCRNIMDLFSGVRGRVSDLFTPTESKYNLPLSFLLGRHMHAIIVDQEKIAYECVNYLRQQRHPPFMFLPLDSIQNKSHFRKGSLPREAVYALDALLPKKQDLLPIFQYILGDSIICETFELSKEMCYEKSNCKKAISLDGTIVYKNGFITGGCINGSAPKYMYKNSDLNSLEKERGRLIESIEAIHKELRYLSNSTSSRNICDIRDNITRIEDERGHVERNIKDSMMILDDLHKKKGVCLNQIEDEGKNLKPLKESIRELNVEFTKKEKEFYEPFEKQYGCHFETSSVEVIRDSLRKKLEFSDQISKIEKRIHYEEAIANDLLVKKTQYLEDYGIVTTQVIELQEKSRVFCQSTNEIKISIEETKNRLDVCKSELDKLNELLVSHKKNIEANNLAIENAAFEISSAKSVIEKCIEEKYDLWASLKLKNVEISIESEIDLDRRYDVDVYNSTERRDFSIGYGEFIKSMKRYSCDEFSALCISRIEKVESELAGLNPKGLNFVYDESIEGKYNNSIEEFEKSKNEVKEYRHLFNEVKENRAKLFNRAFEHISSNIDIIYKELTIDHSLPISVGGNAYFMLEGSDEPYLDNIKYHTMPPYKRFRDMEQLSGGEKTIAALALLFAVQSYRPSPFIILDEVDAALDNPNLLRLASFLRLNSTSNGKNVIAGTQFIMISLKSLLYEQSQSLVGIFRDPQSSSSRVLTLRLPDQVET